MMLFTNQNKRSSFTNEIEQQIKGANKLIFASGYFGYPLIQKLKPKMIKVAKKGECKILLGMIFHSGLGVKQLSELESLDVDLRKINSRSGVYISRKEYHGKIYHICREKKETLYVGSSNFSIQGFESRLECNVKIIEPKIKKAGIDYLNFFFNLPTTSKLNNVDLTKVKKQKPISKTFEDYEVNVKDVPDISLAIGFLEIELRVDSQPASSLNLYFDKGRKNKNNKYEPRPWYEIEIGVLTKDTKNKHYPKSKSNSTNKNSKSRYGTFNAFIKKGSKFYKIKMVVSADYAKNIASHKDSGGRATLGSYIKGQLEDANILKIGDRITSNTLEQYRKSYIRLTKIDDKNYFLNF